MTDFEPPNRESLDTSPLPVNVGNVKASIGSIVPDKLTADIQTAGGGVLETRQLLIVAPHNFLTGPL